MVESCCLSWFEGWCHSEPLLLLGCVQTVSCARGKSWGRDFWALRVWMWGQVMMGLIKIQQSHPLLAWNSKMLTHCSA